MTITFEPADGGTVVRLVHDGLTDEQAANHLQGWVQFLGRLERVAAGDEPGLTEMTASPPDLDPLLSAEACLAVCQLVLRGVSGSDLARPTPCTEFTVAQLVDHLVESLQRLGGMVGAEVAPSGSTDVEPRVADAGQQALEAWRRHGLDGSVPFGDRQLPASFGASLLSLELLVHAWDLAVATDQKVPVSDQMATYVHSLAEQVISPEGRARGAFADAVDVGADASPLDRLVAFTGRPLA